MTNDMHKYIGKTYKVHDLAAVTAGGGGVSLTGNVEVTDYQAEDRQAVGGKLVAYCTIMPLPERGRVRIADQLTCDPYDLISQIAPKKAGEDSAADATTDGHR